MIIITQILNAVIGIFVSWLFGEDYNQQEVIILGTYIIALLGSWVFIFIKRLGFIKKILISLFPLLVMVVEIFIVLAFL
ncbi:hypothetical protein [Helicobacter sp.]|uniref:hypothetical protein n=1 Tax=Helicobacter sp. TaxID=218 RepID=UPI0025BB78E5|nr:hypothetical protein [Helicobacter sp.]MCI5968476.1 hypothetical protein [Helicobacter sp.]MDY2585261.1 hypothetical protein [Helicobacter sp.]